MMRISRTWITIALVIGTALAVWMTSPALAQKCDPAYPTGEDGKAICIPPPPPDLDCKDIIYRNFKVLQPDPHRFDRDKDGIGCEQK